MGSYFPYATRATALRGTIFSLPKWARVAMMIAATPGLLLVALSLVALTVSILALLLLTVPAYLLIARIASPRAFSAGEAGLAPAAQEQQPPVEFDIGSLGIGPSENAPEPARRRVSSTVVK